MMSSSQSFGGSARAMGVSTGRGTEAPLINERRSCFCTDLACCFVFVVALLAYGGLAGIGIKQGNSVVLQRLAGGTDFKGRRCGHDDAVKDFPKTYFTLPDGMTAPQGGNWTVLNRTMLKAVCTSECPDPKQKPGAVKAYRREASLCPPDASEKQLCTWYGGDIAKITGYCIDPGVFKVELPQEESLQALKASWPFLIVAFVLAVTCGFLFLGIVRRCGHVMVITMVVLIAAVPLAVGSLMVFHPETFSDLNHDLTADKQKKMGIILWCISGVLLLMACIFASTIQNVVAVLRATSQFLQDVPSQLVQPVLMAVLQLIVIIVWVVVLLQVSTIGAEEGKSNECLENADLFCIKWNSHSKMYAYLFLLVMLYWMMSFLHAWSHFGTSYAVKAWYFTRADPLTGKKVPAGSTGCLGIRITLEGLGFGLMHHAGSLAMGAFIVAVAKVAYLLLFWATATDPQAQTNPVLRCIYCIANCLAKCVERFIKWVSEHAYVEMALTGRGFIHSAQKALAAAVMKPGLFAVSGSVARIIQLLGLVVVTTGTVLLTFSILQVPALRPLDLTSTTVPLVAAGLIGLIVAEVMLHPFITAARASLHCVILDEDAAAAEGRSGTIHAPQHMQLFLEDYSRRDAQRGCRLCPCC